MRIQTFLAALLITAGLLSTAVLAQGLIAISRRVIPGGGTVSQNSSYTLSGSIGQPAAATSSNGVYRLRAGYWAEHSISRPDNIFLYLPLIDR